MNTIDEIILNELESGKQAALHGKDYSEFSISNKYSDVTIKKHLRQLEQRGLIAKSTLWNKRTATYYKVAN